MTDAPLIPDSGQISHRRWSIALPLLLLCYAAGLTCDITRPWTGLHDWNGAFYSQLARNMLRYPTYIHHGMGVVAVGAEVPVPEERSIYATHPPGMVWLLALAFAMGGQAEWVARLVPILASLVALAFFVKLVRKRRGEGIALLSGAFYVTCPMLVYFGRMVNHEAICLGLMLIILWEWMKVLEKRAASRSISIAIWFVCTFLLIWTDWPGALFSCLFCLHVFAQWRKSLVGTKLLMAAFGWTAACSIAMLVYLVYAGLGGSWADLWAIFTSRSGDAIPQTFTNSALRNTVANLGLPTMVLALIGAMAALQTRIRGSTQNSKHNRSMDARGLSDGMWVLFATGALWILIFHRQYRIHHYWMFYLGPIAALYGALGLVTIHTLIRSTAPRIALPASLAAFALAATMGIHGAMELHKVVDYPIENVNLWKKANQETQPAQRIVLDWDPVLPERHGTYLFRNIVPPQFAFYLDRAFVVQSPR